MYYVYVLRSEKDNKLYIGFSENLIRRLAEHKTGRVTSTKNRKPLQLVYYEAYINMKDAKGRERFLKGGSGHKYLRKQLKNYFLGIR